MIYFIEEVPSMRFKLGWCTGPLRAVKRLDTLQIGNPDPLRFIGVLVDGTRSVETSLKRRLRSFKVRGEWFRPDAMKLVTEKVEEFEVSQSMRRLSQTSSLPPVELPLLLDDERFVSLEDRVDAFFTLDEELESLPTYGDVLGSGPSQEEDFDRSQKQAQLRLIESNRVSAIKRAAKERGRDSKVEEILRLKARGWTQSRIAEELGVSQAAISKTLSKLQRKVS